MTKYSDEDKIIIEEIKKLRDELSQSIDALTENRKKLVKDHMNFDAYGIRLEKAKLEKQEKEIKSLNLKINNLKRKLSFNL